MATIEQPIDEAMTLTVTLSGPSARFVREQLAADRFADAQALVEAAVNHYEDSQEELDALRALIIEGEESGYDPEPFDLERFLAEQRAARA